MRNILIRLMFVLCLLFGATGCSIITQGSGSWEIYAGVRTEVTSDEPASVSVESSVLEESIKKIVDSLTDGKVSPDE